MKPIVVLTHAIFAEGASKLTDRFRLITPPGPMGMFEGEKLASSMREASAVLAGGAITGAMIEGAPKLKIISNYGTGYDRVDVAAASRLGVLVTNIPDYTAWPTAELNMAMILDGRRRLTELDRMLRGVPSDQVFGMGRFMGRSLVGSVLGIVGMGHVGKVLCQMARALGMIVIYHNRKPITGEAAEYVSLEELLRRSDVVSLNCPLTDETRGMIGLAQLSAMKRDALLVNMARGAVMDYEALIHALRNGIIGGAALDVFPDEPAIPPALLSMDNVILSPHIGSNTVEDRVKMARACAERIEIALSGKRPPNVVNPEAWRD